MSLATVCLYGVNAYGEIESDCIDAAIRANPYLHHLLSLFEILYKKCCGGMWVYDEEGNFAIAKHSKRGIRQECALKTFLFPLRMKPVN